MRPRKSCCHFANNIFRCIFLIENIWNSLKISPQFVPKVRINNIPSLVLIMAWWQPGDKPLSEPMMVSLLMHICICDVITLMRGEWTWGDSILEVHMYIWLITTRWRQTPVAPWALLFQVSQGAVIISNHNITASLSLNELSYKCRNPWLQTDLFELEAVDLDTLTKIVVGHDAGEAGKGWFLEKVIIKESAIANRKFLFEVNKWVESQVLLKSTPFDGAFVGCMYWDKGGGCSVYLLARYMNEFLSEFLWSITSSV